MSYCMRMIRKLLYTVWGRINTLMLSKHHAQLLTVPWD